MKVLKKAETSKFRWFTLSRIEFVTNQHYLNLDILDVGCGTDPVSFHADTFDLPSPYTEFNPELLTFCGDARHLSSYLGIKKYDILYSSHLLEDFQESETIPVLNDWAKVVKPEGFIVLLLPDQERYLRHCQFIRESPNQHHSIPYFGMNYMFDCMMKSDYFNVYFMMEFWQRDEPNDYEYNFIMIGQKVQKIGVTRVI